MGGRGAVFITQKVKVYIHMNKSNKAIVIGLGKECPKCKEKMERRKHPPHWKLKQNYYFTQWDYCKPCNFLQHYEEFKSSDWQEAERQENFFKSL